ncbi:MAG: hypothetical protein IJ877_00700 [Candidatus Gastranaerophilales bacterium]|nr:hypothetical protein [Candidatus Gastranaerophilales bacterium]
MYNIESIIKRIAKIICANKIALLKMKITPKKFCNYSADLQIKAYNADLQADKVEKIIQKYSSDPKKLIEYIKGAKTQIHVIKKPEKLLSKIGEEAGFITPLKGIKALYLNLLLNKKISFKTPEMFVIDKDFSSYLFCYEFYKWYCYKTGIKGYDIKSQEKYKKVFNYCETSKIEDLTFDEIIELKTAIKRDIEAIEFVKNYSKKHSQSSKVLNKIKQGKAVRI